MRTAKLLTTMRTLVALVALVATAFITTPTASGQPSAPTSDRMLASYGGEIREADPRADGYRHVDTPATLDKLRHLNNDTFIYLIWDAPIDPKVRQRSQSSIRSATNSSSVSHG